MRGVRRVERIVRRPHGVAELMHDHPNITGGSRCAICGDENVRSVLPTALVIMRPIVGIEVSHEIGTLPLCEGCFQALYAITDIAMAVAHIIPDRCPR